MSVWVYFVFMLSYVGRDLATGKGSYRLSWDEDTEVKQSLPRMLYVPTGSNGNKERGRDAMMMMCVLVVNWTGIGYCFRLKGQRNTMRKSQDNLYRDQSWNGATPTYKSRALPLEPNCPSPNGGLGKLNYSKFMMMIIRIAAYHLMFL